MNFTKKQNNIFIFMIGIFLIFYCIFAGSAYWLAWPKEFRGGVFNKLDSIGGVQQDNSYKIEKMVSYINKYLTCEDKENYLLKIDDKGYVRCMFNEQTDK